MKRNFIFVYGHFFLYFRLLPMNVNCIDDDDDDDTKGIKIVIETGFFPLRLIETVFIITHIFQAEIVSHIIFSHNYYSSGVRQNRIEKTSEMINYN